MGAGGSGGTARLIVAMEASREVVQEVAVEVPGISSRVERDGSLPAGAKYAGLSGHGDGALAAVLQALYMLLPVRETLLVRAIESGGMLTDGGALTRPEAGLLGAVMELMMRVHSLKDRVGTPVDASRIYALLREDAPRADLFSARATYRAIVQLMHQEARVSPTSSPSPKRFSSPFRSLLGIEVATIDKCLNCGFEGAPVREKRWDLGLVPQPNHSLNQLVREWAKPVRFEGEAQRRPCARCECAQDTEQRRVLMRLPSVLAVHLAREPTQGTWLQLSHRVVLPREWKLPSCALSDELRAQPERTFTLQAVVVRTDAQFADQPDSSHHVAVCRAADSWVLLNDGVATIVDSDYLANSYGSYMDPRRRSRAAILMFYSDTT